MRIIVKLLLVMFVIGLVMAVAAVFMGLDIQGLSSFFNDDESYGEQVVFTQDEMINSIDLSAETRDISFIATDDDQMTVLYHEHEKDTWVVNEENGVLSITQTRKFEFFNFRYKTVSPEIRTIFIEVPKTWELDLSIKSNVGTIKIEFDEIMTHGQVLIETNTGKVNLKNLDLESLDVELDTGSTSVVNVTVENDLNIDTSTGTIYVENLVAKNVYVESGTGNVSLNDVVTEDVIANNSTGRITADNVLATGDLVFNTSTGRITLDDTVAGSYDLRASTGDIIVTIDSISDIKLDLKSSTGSVEVDGINQGNSHTKSDGSIIMIARVSTGKITINVQD